MFEKLKDFFSGQGNSLLVDTEGKPTELDVQIATGILLLEMAGADGDYAPEETATIIGVMADQFNIDEDQTVELLEMGDAVRRQPKKLDEVIAAINQHFSPAQKQRVYTMVWKVVLADGRIDKFEQRFAAQLRNRLQLTEQQHESAKKAAESGRI